MALNVKLVKKVNETLQVINPSSKADLVVYEDSLSVKDLIDTLVDAVEDIENKLCLDTVYIQTSDGSIVTDDGGTGLVVVAGLTAVEVTSSDDSSS